MVVCGAALVAAAVAVGAVVPPGIGVALTVLGVIGAATVVFPLRFHHRGEVQGLNVTIGTHLAFLVLVPDALAVVLTTVACVVGYAVATRSWVKTAFNGAQAGVWAAASASAGVLVSGGELGGDVFAPATMGALLVVAAVAAVVNELLVNELFHRMSGTPRLVVLRDVAGPLTGITIAGDLLVGVLLAVLAERSPVAVVLALPLFVGLMQGYRVFAVDREVARRAALLHTTSRQLLDGALDTDALDGAVGSLRELFGADHAALAAGTAELAADVAELVDEVRSTGQPMLRDAAGGAMAAPVVLEGRVVGALVVHGRRGLDAWAASDLALLSTVAGEMAATLRTRQLFGQVERERSQLAAETGKLADVLRSASDGIVLLGPDGHVERWNPAMAAIAGVDADLALGLPWEHVLRLADEDGREVVPKSSTSLARAIEERVPLDRADVQLVAAGRTRWLRCSAAPVHGATGGTVLVVVDRTREHDLEELRTDFIATVSHELRTPLTPLAGFLAVLREHGATLEAPRREMMLTAMQKQVGRLEDLIGDLLLVAEIERGLTRVHREPVRLAAVVEEVLDLEAPSPKQRARVRLHLRGGLALADAAAVRRIVRSLLSNALKHTDGPVDVLVESDGERAVVEVADHGPGVAEEERETIFEPFRRLGNHLHRTQGPGLGLSVARSLAEALQGSLDTRETVGGGATFVLQLPGVASAGGGAAALEAPAGAPRGRR